MYTGARVNYRALMFASTLIILFNHKPYHQLTIRYLRNMISARLITEMKNYRCAKCDLVNNNWKAKFKFHDDFKRSSQFYDAWLTIIYVLDCTVASFAHHEMAEINGKQSVGTSHVFHENE